MSDTIITIENVIQEFETSAPKGDKGDPGGDVIPTDVTIHKDINGNISSLEFASGKTITINRDINGEIISVSDGTYTKTIIREDGDISQIIIT